MRNPFPPLIHSRRLFPRRLFLFRPSLRFRGRASDFVEGPRLRIPAAYFQCGLYRGTLTTCGNCEWLSYIALAQEEGTPLLTMKLPNHEAPFRCNSIVLGSGKRNPPIDYEVAPRIAQCVGGHHTGDIGKLLRFAPGTGSRSKKEIRGFAPGIPELRSFPDSGVLEPRIP